jgi:hypothetical protein
MRVFGRRVLKMTRGWRKLHNDELHALYSLPCVIKMTKSRRMSWEGPAALIGEKMNACSLLVEKTERKSKMYYYYYLI